MNAFDKKLRSYHFNSGREKSSLFMPDSLGFISRSGPEMCSLCCSNINIWIPTAADLHIFPHLVIGTHLTKNCVPTTSIQGEIKKTHFSLTNLASFQDLALRCVVCAVQISTYGPLQLLICISSHILSLERI